jgi:hypothetical protein
MPYNNTSYMRFMSLTQDAIREALPAAARDDQFVNFESIPCLLTVEELDQKCDEQFIVTWNGPNRFT